MIQVAAPSSIRDALERHETTREDVLDALGLLPGARVLLVGDFIADWYTYCTAIGKTSKTPTLSVKRGPTDRFWGGSGLFATNLLGLGAIVEYVTVCGDDWGAGYLMREPPANLSLHVVVDPTRPTTIKERFWVDGYKLLQVDTLENAYIPGSVHEQVAGAVAASIGGCDLVLTSDSRHGMMSPELIQFMKRICREHGKPLVVDTQVSNRRGNVDEYCGVDLICANETEARDCIRDERCGHDVLLDKLRDCLRVRRVIVKLGLDGLMGFDDREHAFRLPAVPVDVRDPIGSGDAFLSAAALTFRPQVKVMASMFIAACAGALAVTKMGTVPNTLAELTGFVERTLDDVF
jgi:rfaE bifunctional protein kinase chain/domain